MRKKLKIMTIFLIIILMIGCGLETKQDNQKQLTDMNLSNFTKQLSEYDSAYTLCYENKDGTYSFFIFASPIQYQSDDEYTLIDNNLNKASKQKYAFENKSNNIKAYFPKQLQDGFHITDGIEYIDFVPDFGLDNFAGGHYIKYDNMYGDAVDAVVYKSDYMELYFYPIKSGIKVEAVFRKKVDSTAIRFKIFTSGSTSLNKDNGYILFQRDSQNISLLYQPLISYYIEDEKIINYSSKLKIYKEDNFYSVHLLLDTVNLEQVQYPIKFDMSFELYMNKMPDTSVSSNFNINSYLKNFAVIGDSIQFGECWHYIRTRLNYVVPIDSNHIISAEYVVKNLKNDTVIPEIEFYKLPTEWSSTQMVWTTRQFPDSQLDIKYNQSLNHYIHCDITEYAKDCFNDPTWDLENYGFLLKVKGEGSNLIIATSDNASYTPYIKLILSDLPDFFQPINNINPS